MKINLNLGSFILSLICIPVFFIALFPRDFLGVFTNNIGAYPLKIVLSITVITFFLGLLGLKDVREWKAMARSIFTITLTIGLSAVLIVIIFMGRLLG
ncbi:hypothetical protein FITA111629_04415 [Filibacter tadaridae]|uniref:Uncharacterized protein n=1 Tax=Filibacter tadaridae TaxID=2483811 RepID=A0A3P5XCW2_9BACL|nr:hypothetical protein [Filibacter tadaridae]VDC32538.1 hypothetical protein FILTAD_02748 [Filibacter tadaridae]